jgi:hypothetical protein
MFGMACLICLLALLAPIAIDALHWFPRKHGNRGAAIKVRFSLGNG